jgi:hypothetical protein
MKGFEIEARFLKGNHATAPKDLRPKQKLETKQNKTNQSVCYIPLK